MKRADIIVCSMAMLAFAALGTAPSGCKEVVGRVSCSDDKACLDLAFSGGLSVIHFAAAK
jgi:hypothetical protein